MGGREGPEEDRMGWGRKVAEAAWTEFQGEVLFKANIMWLVWYD